VPSGRRETIGFRCCRSALPLLLGLLGVWARPTAGGDVPCAGDCSGDGVVTINELVIGVEIALGGRPLVDCPPFDATASGAVTLDELIRAVNAALSGCEVGPGPSPTSTPSLTPAPASVTPSSSAPTSASTRR